MQMMHNRTKHWRTFIVCLTATLAICLVLAGCGPNHRQPLRQLTLAEAVGHVNANNLQINQFRSKHVNLIIKFKDQDGHNHRYDLSGASLIYQRPMDLYLSANHLGGRAMLIGSNQNRYWLGIVPQENTLWWGLWANSGRECSGRLYIELDKLLEALGVGLLAVPDDNFFGPMLQVRKDANVLVYGAWDRDLQQHYIAREIHLQRRKPFLIKQIVYYNRQGHKTLTMTLGRYRHLGADGPQLAHHLEMIWPDQEGKFTADLSWVKMDTALSPRTFDFPDITAYDNVHQIDADCTELPH